MRSPHDPSLELCRRDSDNNEPFLFVHPSTYHSPMLPMAGMIEGPPTPSEVPDADTTFVDTIDTLPSSAAPETIYQDARPHRRTRARRPSIRKNVARRQGRRLIRQYHEWKSAHLYLARYSIEKMLAFKTYQQTATLNHALAVITLTPIPTLVVVLLLAAIPFKAHWLQRSRTRCTSFNPGSASA